MSDRIGILARGLRFRFGRSEVLRGVDLDVRPGELVALVGPNGAGKSTLLRVLLGFLDASDGSITIDGTPVADLTRRQIAQRAAFVPQGFHTEFAFDVREMVAMGRTPHLGRFRPQTAEDREAIDEAMRATGIRGMAERPFTELSGGERQRVLLARAFAQRTPLLLLDEPNANLDLKHAYELMELVRARADAGAAALAALHDLTLAARFCDRLVVLCSGRVHADGPPTEVLTEDLMREVFEVDARIVRNGPALLLRIDGDRIPPLNPS